MLFSIVIRINYLIAIEFVKKLKIFNPFVFHGIFIKCVKITTYLSVPKFRPVSSFNLHALPFSKHLLEIVSEIMSIYRKHILVNAKPYRITYRYFDNGI